MVALSASWTKVGSSSCKIMGILLFDMTILSDSYLFYFSNRIHWNGFALKMKRVELSQMPHPRCKNEEKLGEFLCKALEVNVTP